MRYAVTQRGADCALRRQYRSRLFSGVSGAARLAALFRYAVRSSFNAALQTRHTSIDSVYLLYSLSNRISWCFGVALALWMADTSKIAR
jgi:hypothetical protein